jgi:hypothetical protein
MERHPLQDAMTASLERLQRAQLAAGAPALRPWLELLQRWQAARLAAEYADQARRPARRAAVESSSTTSMAHATSRAATRSSPGH